MSFDTKESVREREEQLLPAFCSLADKTWKYNSVLREQLQTAEHKEIFLVSSYCPCPPTLSDHNVAFAKGRINTKRK